MTSLRIESWKRVLGLLIWFTCVILIPAPAFADLTVDNDLNTTTKEHLANTVIGSGITIMNVEYTGNPGAAGTFSGGADIIGIDSGILLSSGAVANAVGPNDSGGTSSGFGEPGDSDLNALADVLPGVTTADAAVLEFDFEAIGPVVQFRYVFGSDEYNEFANSGYNDVFGFFINDVNVALLPDSDISVAINHVNGGWAFSCTNLQDDDGDGLIDSDDPDCTTPEDNIVGENPQNAEFYIDNDCHSAEIPGGCPFDIEADGMTVVLTITAAVNPGTNHIKLAIQDVGDSAFDSWVFIEAESFVPANDSWLYAEEVVLNSTGFAHGRIDQTGAARWYRFAIQPGAQATIELPNPPADFDLAVFKDIAKAFLEQIVPNNPDDLNQLNAEFAPTAFSPTALSPTALSPTALSPTAFSPTAFSETEFSPYAFSPTALSPTALSPYAFSPTALSPYAFSATVLGPTAFSPTAFSPELSPTAFSDAFVGAQVSSLIALSAGNGTERVIADTWNNTGDFYVRVTGKNGAIDPLNDFQLRIDLEGELCTGVVDIPDGPIGLTSGVFDTIILWDSGRMDPGVPGNSGDNIVALSDRLEELANDRSEVSGVVVDLAGLPHIQALHAQADSHSSCPFAVNLTAQAIKRVIDAYHAVNPGLRYIVIAGGDDAVPFFRYPDQSLLGPESAYDPPVADQTISQGALRTNHVLGQDEYGATVLSMRDGDFPLPRLAVGRLVESAAEMITVLDAYLATVNGIVDQPNSTLVTGYDFLEDAANAIQEELVAGVPGRNDTLISANNIAPSDPASWTATELHSELLDEGEDIVFLAGHFSANSALAADYESILITTDLAASDVDLTNTLVYSAGCHSGYNIVDRHGIPGMTLNLDWPQAFALQGATLIAGTGYQYGDTDFIEYSERLYLEFTRQLRTGSPPLGEGPVSIGEALVKAKQRYLAETTDIRGLHRKAVLISTLFGLPMLQIDMPGDRLVDSTEASTVAPAAFTVNPGLTLGLQWADVGFDFTNPTPLGDGLLNEQTVDLANVEDNNALLTASYLEGPDGSVVTNPAEPALPLDLKNVTVDGYSARGLGFRGGSWFEESIIPLTGAPATEIRGVHIPFSSPLNYPMRFATLNYFDAIAGAGTANGNTFLLVTPVQHRVSNFGDIEATRRQFDDLSFRVFYSNNTTTYTNGTVGFGGNTPALAAPPSMTGARVVTDGNDIVFIVNVFGDPAAGIQNVWVTYTDGAASCAAAGPPYCGQWVSLDLTQDTDDSTLWTGRLANALQTFGRLDAMFQAVNGVGLVSVNDNYGAYYKIAGALGEVGPDGVLDDIAPSEIALATSSTSGVPGDDITLQATLTSEGSAIEGAPVLFTLGLSASAATTDANGFAEASMTLTATPGKHILAVSFDGDGIRSASSAELEFVVGKAATLLTLEGMGGVSGLSAALTDEHGTPLLERTVYFTVSDDSEFLFTEPVITDNLGLAHFDTPVLPPQSHGITARFLGDIPTETPGSPLVLDDPIYLPSSDEMFDSDGDGVYDAVDLCANTTIPESVPTKKLNPNNWALIDADFDFDTVVKGNGEGPGRSYSMTDTVGCSCEQIIAAQGLGSGHTKNGCSIGAMDNWVEQATGNVVETE